MPVDPRIRSYVGIPFMFRGRTKEGADCWGLSRLVLAEIYGKQLPSFDIFETLDPALVASLIDAEKALLSLVQVPSPLPGDLVIMRCMGHITHVGVYVGDSYVLHSDMFGHGTSKLDRITSANIAARIEGFYRIP